MRHFISDVAREKLGKRSHTLGDAFDDPQLRRPCAERRKKRRQHPVSHFAGRIVKERSRTEYVYISWGRWARRHWRFHIRHSNPDELKYDRTQATGVVIKRSALQRPVPSMANSGRRRRAASGNQRPLWILPRRTLLSRSLPPPGLGIPRPRPNGSAHAIHQSRVFRRVPARHPPAASSSVGRGNSDDRSDHPRTRRKAIRRSAGVLVGADGARDLRQRDPLFHESVRASLLDGCYLFSPARDQSQPAAATRMVWTANRPRIRKQTLDRILPDQSHHRRPRHSRTPLAQEQMALDRRVRNHPAKPTQPNLAISARLRDLGRPKQRKEDS